MLRSQGFVGTKADSTCMMGSQQRLCSQLAAGIKHELVAGIASSLQHLALLWMLAPPIHPHHQRLQPQRVGQFLRPLRLL